jgi:phage FluMu protein Com
MAIEFHCEHCGKFIRAADEHGGKHGKCPACHQRVYIPSSDIEPLELAPIDEDADRRARQMAQESNRLADALLNESLPPSGGLAGASAGARGAAGPTRPAPARAEPAVPNIDIASTVHEYAIAMFEGELEEAQQHAEALRRFPRQMEEVVQRIVSDELPPPAVEHIPRPLLMGFLKQLRSGG